MFRIVCAMAAVVALAGCRPTHATGAFASPGAAAGELGSGDHAFVCEEGDGRCTYQPGEVCGDDGGAVLFCHINRSYESRAVVRSHLIPAERIVPGTLLQLPDRSWAQVTYAQPKVVSVEGEPMPLLWSDVTALTADAARYDHHVRVFDTTAGAILLALAFAMLAFARQLQRRASAQERVADHAAAAAAPVAPAPDAPQPHRTDRRHAGARPTAPAAPAAPAVPPAPTEPALGTRELEVLRCPTCASPIQLVAAAQTSCAGCGASVVVPPAYVDLVGKRRYLTEHLSEQTAALRRARIMAHPAVAVALLVAAVGSYEAFRWLMAHLSGGEDAAFWVLSSFTLFYLPVGFIVAAIGQLSGRGLLAKAVPELAALREEHRYACRGCGAPLGATRDGVAEVCVYCGVQNLIAAQVASSDAAARATTTALRRTLASASASFWSRFDRVFVAPLYVAGAIGVLLYPFILYLGLST